VRKKMRKRERNFDARMELALNLKKFQKEKIFSFGEELKCGGTTAVCVASVASATQLMEWKNKSF
jgi:hypothetical protein